MASVYPKNFWNAPLAHLSPLTYAQDLNHAVPGVGLLNPWLDLAVLLASGFCS